MPIPGTSSKKRTIAADKLFQKEWFNSQFCEFSKVGRESPELRELDG